jgi:hypothetical protein
MKVLLSCPEGKKLIRGCDGLDRTPLFIACKNGHNQVSFHFFYSVFKLLIQMLIARSPNCWCLTWIKTKTGNRGELIHQTRKKKRR